MTQTIPATAILGPGKTGLAIGLRVLNLDGTTYAAFSTTDVAETSTAGTYRKAGGVVVPLAGGYIVWGTALVDYAEATVESTAVNVTMQAGVAVAAADANGNIPVNIKTIKGSLAAVDGLAGLSEWYDAESYVAVLGQDIADALLLAPSGAAAAGSAMAELAAILADSNELQTDWANGGRLDVILDAAAAGGGLDAAGVRAAVGLAAANLDTQLSTIDGIVDALALVAPDNQPIVNADGETLAYMTALSEEEIAAAVIVALQETPVEVICVTPQPSEESDYDILRNNATNC